MKYVKQFAIIAAITFVGEILNALIPLPVPAGIYGVVILFLLLIFGILSADAIRETAKFFIGILPILFIPSLTGLIESWDILRPALIPFFILALVSTIVVMVTAGHASQLVIRLIRTKKHKKEDEAGA